MAKLIQSSEVPFHYFMSQQSRRWCLTLNNPENYCTNGRDITLEELFSEYDKTSGLRYAIWQLEKGDEGTPHIQAYVEFGRPTRFSFIKPWFDTHGHWEVARKPREACVRYCSKEPSRISGPWEFGDSQLNPGKRTDILECKRMLDDNVPESEIAETCFKPWAKYFKAFREYRRIRSPSRDFKTQVYVFWGVSGTGKTRLAKFISDAGSTYWLAPNSSWFDDYEGQENVIIDDFYGTLPYSTLLRVLDRTELRLESKGGHINFVAKRIFITSNKQPAEWYDCSKHPLDALRRRIDFELYFLCENQRTLIKGSALPSFFKGWGLTIRLTTELGDEISPMDAEEEMRRHYNEALDKTVLSTFDCDGIEVYNPNFGPSSDGDDNNWIGYTTEEWSGAEGKQNVIDLTE